MQHLHPSVTQVSELKICVNEVEMRSYLAKYASLSDQDILLKNTNLQSYLRKTAINYLL